MEPRSETVDLLADVPRGNTSRYKQDQRMPEAHWMSQETILNSPMFAYDPKNPSGKILIGACGSKLIGVADDRHIQTVAGTRAGKSVTVIANLLLYDGSVIAMDMKAELAIKTAARRAAMGQDVYVLDPFKRAHGEAAKFRARFNPLASLNLESDTVIEDAQQIVDALIVSTGQEKDPHWNESAGAAILGLILYACFGPDVPDEDRHLGTVRRFVTRALETVIVDGKPQDFALRRQIIKGVGALRSAGHADVADTIEASVRGLYEKSRDERASVISTMNRHTAFLEYRNIRDVLSGNDFDLRDLKRKPNGMSVYLCLPATRMNSCSRWFRILINQLIVAMEMEETEPEAPVLAVLDEFPVLGFMPQIQDAAGQMASFGLKLWTLLQDWSQGQALYGQRWESFAANSGVSIFHGNVDVTTTQYVSNRLGKTPVVTTSQGEPSRTAVSEGQSGLSLSTALYDLMMPDEIARIFGRADPLKRQLVLLAGLDPLILQLVEYWNKRGPFAAVFDEGANLS
jgi:type IV secretion system protein VirD4